MIDQKEIVEILSRKPLINKQGYSVEMYNSLKVHAEGLFPAKILEKQRPNEDDKAYAYRKESFISATKQTYQKVLNFSKKIWKAQDFDIRFKDIDGLPKAVDLETYSKTELPYFGSVRAWAEELLHGELLMDPNALISVLPISFDVEPTEFLEPYPFIINSNRVIEYSDGEYAIYIQNYNFVDGRPDSVTVLVIDKEAISKYIVFLKDDEKIIQDGEPIFHGFDELPVFKVKGVLVDFQGGQKTQDSLMSSMLESLDRAARNDSDKEAAYTLHVYPQKWEITTEESFTCSQKGKSVSSLCRPDCGCKPSPSPFAVMRINPNNTKPGQNFAVPSPPAGYLSIDIEVIDKLDKKVEFELYQALSSLNLEFLNTVQLNQSGTAKEFDRQEVNGFLSQVASQIIYTMQLTYKWIAKWRYQGNIKAPILSTDQIIDVLPKMKVPRKFDILTSGIQYDRLSQLKSSGASPQLISMHTLKALELDFGEDSDQVKKERLVAKFDPFLNQTENELALIYGNKSSLATLEDIILHQYIRNFIEAAIDNDEDFLDKDSLEQMAVLGGYVKEKIGVIEAAKEKERVELVDFEE